jgi:hypothetical protein
MPYVHALYVWPFVVPVKKAAAATHPTIPMGRCLRGEALRSVTGRLTIHAHKA